MSDLDRALARAEERLSKGGWQPSASGNPRGHINMADDCDLTDTAVGSFEATIALVKAARAVMSNEVMIDTLDSALDAWATAVNGDTP